MEQKTREEDESRKTREEDEVTVWSVDDESAFGTLLSRSQLRNTQEYNPIQTGRADSFRA